MGTAAVYTIARCQRLQRSIYERLVGLRAHVSDTEHLAGQRSVVAPDDDAVAPQIAVERRPVDAWRQPHRGHRRRSEGFVSRIELEAEPTDPSSTYLGHACVPRQHVFESLAKHMVGSDIQRRESVPVVRIREVPLL